MAEKRRRRRRRKKRFRIDPFRMVLAVIFIIAILAIAVSVKNVIDLKQEQAALKKENTKLTEQKAALEKEFQKVNDSDYIERQARKKLKMIKPGEKLYIVDNDGDGQADSSTSDASTSTDSSQSSGA